MVISNADIVVSIGCLSSQRVADKRSLDSMQTRLLTKVFKTGSVNIVHECCVTFNIRSESSLMASCRRKFSTKFWENHGNSIRSAVPGLTVTLATEVSQCGTVLEMSVGLIVHAYVRVESRCL